MKLPRVLGVAAVLVCLAMAAFVIYGLRTDCAHTSGYVDCSTPSDAP